MIKRSSGRVIFVASENAVLIPAEMVHYGVTKCAQLAVARGLAEQTRGTGVTVNSILPGPTRSEGITAFIESVIPDTGITQPQRESLFFFNGICFTNASSDSFYEYFHRRARRIRPARRSVCIPDASTKSSAKHPISTTSV
jgi:short-subunit dehydrogenase